MPWGARGVEVVAIGGLDAIPPFCVELVDDAPGAVVAFPGAVESVDGLLVAAPEYAGGVAGAVKNALDWLVGGVVALPPRRRRAQRGNDGRHFRHRAAGADDQLAGRARGRHAVDRVAAHEAGRDGAFTDVTTIDAIASWAGAVADVTGEPGPARLARVAPIVAPLGIDIDRFGDLAEAEARTPPGCSPALSHPPRKVAGMAEVQAVAYGREGTAASATPFGPPRRVIRSRR